MTNPIESVRKATMRSVKFADEKFISLMVKMKIKPPQGVDDEAGMAMAERCRNIFHEAFSQGMQHAVTEMHALGLFGADAPLPPWVDGDGGK